MDFLNFPSNGNSKIQTRLNLEMSVGRTYVGFNGFYVNAPNIRPFNRRLLDGQSVGLNGFYVNAPTYIRPTYVRWTENVSLVFPCSLQHTSVQRILCKRSIR